ncbi:MAG: recombination mediator RecR [Elusimicrobiota bacterium]
MRSFDTLIGCLKRLPGIGAKQAERLAVHLLRAPRSEAEALSAAILKVRERVRRCGTCQNFTEDAECRICASLERDRSVVCVVEQPADVAAIERSRGYRGLYHVLHGHLSPLKGIGPESLKIKELIDRIRGGNGLSEVVLATDPDTEGEATALYLASTLKGLSVKVTRIAQGVPMGAHIDYMDEQTLSCALRTRREFSQDASR